MSEDVKQTVLKLKSEGKSLQQISSKVGISIDIVSDIVMKWSSSSIIAGYNKGYEHLQSGDSKTVSDFDNTGDKSDSLSENDGSESTEEDFSEFDKPDSSNDDNFDLSGYSDTEPDFDKINDDETTEIDTSETSAVNTDNNSVDEGMKAVMSVLSSSGHVPGKLKEFAAKLKALANDEKPTSEKELSRLTAEKAAKIAEIKQIDAKIEEIQADIDFWDKLCGK